MKIRIEVGSLAWSSVTGVGYYTRLLTNSLAEHPGNSVDAFYFDFLKRHPISHMKNIPKRLRIYALPYVPNKIYNKFSSFGLRLPCDATLPLADVTIFPNYILWPTIKSKLTAVVVHDLSFVYFPEHAEGGNLKSLKEDHVKYLNRVVPKAIKNADFIITVSETVKSEIAKQFSVPLSRIVVTPIPPAESYSICSTTNAFKKFKISTKYYILHPGTLQPRKNITDILEAYLKLPRAVKQQYSLVLAGGWGWKSEAIKQAVSSAKAEGENIVVTGYYDFDDAPALYQQAAVTLMYSHYEGFGMQALETMASKTPLIAADIPVFNEVAGDAALYAEPGNPTDLSIKIEQLLIDKELQKQFVARGQKNLKRFSWQQNARHLTDYVAEKMDRFI